MDYGARAWSMEFSIFFRTPSNKPPQSELIFPSVKSADHRRAPQLLKFHLFCS